MAPFPFTASLLALTLLLLRIVDATKVVVVPASQFKFQTPETWTFADSGKFCSQDHYWTNNRTGAIAAYTFEGLSVTVQAFKFSDGAKISIDLDGKKTEVDTHVDTHDCFAELFDSGMLPYGRHTITFTTLDMLTFYVRGVTYTTYDSEELHSVIMASVSSVQLASQSALSTASAATASATGQSNNSSSQTGLIIGAVCGTIIALGLIIAVLIYVLRKRKDKRRLSEAGSTNQTQPLLMAAATQPLHENPTFARPIPVIAAAPSNFDYNNLSNVTGAATSGDSTNYQHRQSMSRRDPTGSSASLESTYTATHSSQTQSYDPTQIPQGFIIGPDGRPHHPSVLSPLPSSGTGTLGHQTARSIPTQFGIVEPFLLAGLPPPSGPQRNNTKRRTQQQQQQQQPVPPPLPTSPDNESEASIPLNILPPPYLESDRKLRAQPR